MPTERLQHASEAVRGNMSDYEYEEDVADDACYLHEVELNTRSRSLPVAGQKQLYDWLLVLDFESTCCETKDLAPIEIIEIGVVLVNARTLEQVCVYDLGFGSTSQNQYIVGVNFHFPRPQFSLIACESKCSFVPWNFMNTMQQAS